MAAEKLRDLTQPMDVSLLDATVAAFYGTGSKEEVGSSYPPSLSLSLSFFLFRFFFFFYYKYCMHIDKQTHIQESMLRIMTPKRGEWRNDRF